MKILKDHNKKKKKHLLKMIKKKKKKKIIFMVMEIYILFQNILNINLGLDIGI